MSLVLVYWIAIAALGLAAALSAMVRSMRFSHQLKHTDPTILPLPVDELLKANRWEIARDGFLASGLAANLVVGVSSALAIQVPGVRGVANGVVLVGLLTTGTLLSLYAVLNYWLRTR